MNNSFCFIPAKAASTRLKQKNLLKLGGKELIYYPIQLARSSKLLMQMTSYFQLSQKILDS